MTTPLLNQPLPSAFLGNRVFRDLNGNGIQDDGDIGVDGVTVTLTGAGADGSFGTADDLWQSGTTLNGGYFGFSNLPAGNYKLSFSNVPSGYGFSPLDQGSDGGADSDVDPTTGSTFIIDLQAGAQNKAVDAGLRPTSGSGSANGTGTRFNYGEALQKSFLFYEAQRSGALPGDNRIAWRGDSALDDGRSVGLDLSGGYFDAGDHVKYNFSTAATLTLLSWGVVQYRDGYERSGQLGEALAAIRWGTDFLLKSHVVENGKTQRFWAQVGDPTLDQAVLELPEQLNTARPAYSIDATQPGSDLAAEAAAALASASIIFRPTDPGYADELLRNAQQLYAFADQYRGSYTVALPDDSTPYRPRTGFEDELAWGAVWLHKALKAKGEPASSYLSQAEAQYANFNFGWTQDWDNKSQGAAILLAQETGKERYKNDVSDWLGNWLPGGSVTQTGGGLAWLGNWGSLRLSANTAFLAGIYADTVADPGGNYSEFAKRQIDYLLGDNPRGASYVVGFGNNAPQRVHHQAAFGSTDEALWASEQVNRNIIYGALVGGPTAPDDFAFKDDRQDYRANEVSLEYNAGYTGALARLYSRHGGEPLSNEALNALPGIQVQGGAVLENSDDAANSGANGTAEEEITVLTGSAANDSLFGTSGDDDLLGEAGSDRLSGGDGFDFLYGTNSVSRGRGEVDELTGGAGADLFFLGDALGSFYNNQGDGDFARITDFEPGLDQLFLYGSAAEYSVVTAQGETRLFWQGQNGDRDLIAVLSNAPVLDLSTQRYG